MVEHLLHTQGVTGSSPAVSTIKKPFTIRFVRGFCFRIDAYNLILTTQWVHTSGNKAQALRLDFHVLF